MKKKFLILLCLISTFTLYGCKNSFSKNNISQKTENSSNTTNEMKIEKEQIEKIKDKYLKVAMSIYGKSVSVSLKTYNAVKINNSTYVMITFENKTSDDTYNRLVIAKTVDGNLALMPMEVEKTPVPEGLPALNFNCTIDKSKFKITHFVPVSDIKTSSPSKTAEYIINFIDNNGVAELSYESVPMPAHNVKEIDKLISKQFIVSEKLGNLALIFNGNNDMKLDKNDINSPFVWNKFDILNEMNIYSHEECDFNSIIEKLKTLFKKPSDSPIVGEYIEKDMSYQELTPDMINKLKGDNDKFNSIRLIKDNTIMVYLPPGYGGIFPVPQQGSNTLSAGCKLRSSPNNSVICLGVKIMPNVCPSPPE